uniref:Secreted protein n=2 Tax=Steinernema glaseri TaxID=37863 RepID=A0A1I7XZC8_9BILA
MCVCLFSYWPAAAGSRVPMPHRLQHVCFTYLDAGHDEAAHMERLGNPPHRHRPTRLLGIVQKLSLHLQMCVYFTLSLLCIYGDPLVIIMAMIRNKS